MLDSPKSACCVVVTGLAGVAGFFAFDKLYRIARDRYDSKSGEGDGKLDTKESRWVCPGVGVAGAVVTAGCTGLLLNRIGNSAGSYSYRQCPVMNSMAVPGSDHKKLDLPGFTMSD